MTIFFLLSLGLASVVPTYFDEDRRMHMVSVTLPGGQQMRCIPFLESTSIIPTIFDPADLQVYQRNVDRMRGGVVTFDHSYATMRLERVSFQHSFADRLHLERSWLALGFQSDLVRQYSSVDYIRDQSSGAAQLVLGSLEDNFINDNCLDGSLIRARDRYRNTVSHLGDRFVFFGKPKTSVLNVNLADFLTLFGTIRDQISFILNENDQFTIENCSENLGALPDISFAFQSGNFVITPADYTKMTGHDDVCDLLVVIDPEVSSEGIHINPLLVPGINIRITSNEIIICDAM